jgi:hypothetical protein
VKNCDIYNKDSVLPILILTAIFPCYTSSNSVFNFALLISTCPASAGLWLNSVGRKEGAEKSMPDQANGTKPPRMHGITHVDIPAQYMPVSKPSGSKQPLFVTLILAYLLIKAAVCFLLALVPWSDPDSGVATYLSARPALVFGLLPRMFFPAAATAGISVGRLAEGLPFIFLIVGLLYVASAWKLGTQDKFWISIIRWGLMFAYGATAAKTLIALSARYVGEQEAPLSDSMKLALLISVAWNLIIFCCFAFYPNPEQAYDSKV